MHTAWAKVAQSNLAKIAEDGKVHKREYGKVKKPDGWLPPDLSDCVPQLKTEPTGE
jgi:predicted HAD superfamily Cof-like phosphohydrolase